MQRACDSCGEMYEAKRQSSKFCSDRCRVHAHATSRAAPPPVTAPAVAAGPGPVAVATVAELDAAGRLESALGRAAVAMARRLDANALDTGSAVASLAREWRATLAAATQGAQAQVSSVDELRSRRESRAS